MTFRRRRILLVTPLRDAAADEVGAVFEGCEVVCLRTADDLAAMDFDPSDRLVTYGTASIIPGSILRRLAGPSYNFHPAPPSYPGFEPHNFAIYEGARVFGATAHELTAQIDSGPILGVDLFDIPEGCLPNDLLRLAADALLRVARILGPPIARGDPLPILEGVGWGTRRITSGDHKAIRTIPAGIGADEFRRRLRGFEDGTGQLITTIHGRSFRLVPDSSNLNTD